jgi:hypothetical protein
MITFTSAQQELIDSPEHDAKLLVKIVAPTTTLRYCTGSEPMYISGSKYSIRAIQPGDFTYAPPSEGRMEIQISNHDNAISSVGLANPGLAGSQITLSIYLRKKHTAGDWTLIAEWSMRISGIGWDEEWAKLTMTGLTGLKPHMILTVGSRTCSNRGGDGRCQYGSDIICGGTYDECVTFSNTTHFNGFRFAPDPDATIELNYLTFSASGDIRPEQQTMSDWLRYPYGLRLGVFRDTSVTGPLVNQ